VYRILAATLFLPLPVSALGPVPVPRLIEVAMDLESKLSLLDDDYYYCYYFFEEHLSFSDQSPVLDVHGLCHGHSFQIFN